MQHRTYTWDELVNFIDSQKDDRVVDSLDHEVRNVGDVLVHFGRKKLKKKITSVGMTSIGYGDKPMKYLCPKTSEDVEKVSKLIQFLIRFMISDYRGIKKAITRI